MFTHTHTHSHTENNASYEFVWAVLEDGLPLHHIKQRPTESQTRFDILICTPSRISLYPKLKCMCYDLISQTLAADNKTKWFHKSTARLLWAMTAWFLKSSVKNFAQQGFYQAIYLIYHPAPPNAALKLQANKRWDLPDYCSLASHKWGCLFSTSE